MLFISIVTGALSYKVCSDHLRSIGSNQFMRRRTRLKSFCSYLVNPGEQCCGSIWGIKKVILDLLGGSNEVNLFLLITCCTRTVYKYYFPSFNTPVRQVPVPVCALPQNVYSKSRARKGSAMKVTFCHIWSIGTGVGPVQGDRSGTSWGLSWALGNPVVLIQVWFIAADFMALKGPGNVA